MPPGKVEYIRIVIKLHDVPAAIKGDPNSANYTFAGWKPNVITAGAGESFVGKWIHGS